jgi:hypothetical protein
MPEWQPELTFDTASNASMKSSYSPSPYSDPQYALPSSDNPQNHEPFATSPLALHWLDAVQEASTSLSFSGPFEQELLELLAYPLSHTKLFNDPLNLVPLSSVKYRVHFPL